MSIKRALAGMALLFLLGSAFILVSCVKIGSYGVVIQVPRISIARNEHISWRIFLIKNGKVMRISSVANDTSINQWLVSAVSSKAPKKSFPKKQPSAIYFLETPHNNNVWTSDAGGLYAYLIDTERVVQIVNSSDFDISEPTEVFVSLSKYSSIDDVALLGGEAPCAGEQLNDFIISLKPALSSNSHRRYYVGYDNMKEDSIAHQYSVLDFSETYFKGKKVRKIRFANEPDLLIGTFDFAPQNFFVFLPHISARAFVYYDDDGRGDIVRQNSRNTLFDALNNVWFEK